MAAKIKAVMFLLPRYTRSFEMEKYRSTSQTEGEINISMHYVEIVEVSLDEIKQTFFSLDGI